VTGLYAIAPALPLGKAGKFVVAAYIVFVALILVYVAIMAARAQRLESELAQLRRDVEAARAVETARADEAREETPAGGRGPRPPVVASQRDDVAAARSGEPGWRAGGTATGERGPA